MRHLGPELSEDVCQHRGGACRPPPRRYGRWHRPRRDSRLQGRRQDLPEALQPPEPMPERPPRSTPAGRCWRPSTRRCIRSCCRATSRDARWGSCGSGFQMRPPARCRRSRDDDGVLGQEDSSLMFWGAWQRFARQLQAQQPNGASGLWFWGGTRHPRHARAGRRRVTSAGPKSHPLWDQT